MDRRMRMGRALARAITPLALIGSALALMMTPALAGVTGPSGVAEPTWLAEQSQVPTGADVSYPQCGGALPFGQAFGVVGVNGGRASTRNPCLGEELAWAVYRTTGAASEPKASMYLNTGDPGNSYLGEPVPDWPLSGGSPFGSCLPTIALAHLRGPGQNSEACAWDYGYQEATQDLLWLRSAASKEGLPAQARDYPFWLDVETSNTWQTAPELNLADLEGMVDALRQGGAGRLGVYAFPQEWVEITGGTKTAASGSLFPLPNWILGSDSLPAAESNCQESPLTGGKVLLTQFPLGPFDGDYAC